GRAHRLERSLALADGRHPDLGPRRQGVHAQLVDVGAELVGGGEGRLDVLTARGEVAHHADRLALLHLRELELLAVEVGEPGRVHLLRAIRRLHHLPIMARHTRYGVAGISRSVTPSGVSASRSALTTAAGAPIAPDSPQPLAPSGLWVQGWLSSVSEAKLGRSVARGSA